MDYVRPARTRFQSGLAFTRTESTEKVSFVSFKHYFDKHRASIDAQSSKLRAELMDGDNQMR
ncbi:MAG: hypothetical protein DMF74_17870 [Acidobacteria bacterium]|nr:MAG: hypothetical protein DMF74_17870 [Acidobacteriota bacterium]